MKWKKLLLIGDSHIQYGYTEEIGGGWLCRLSDYAQRKFDVINRGFSGYNSFNIRTYLPQLLEEFDAESVCGIVLVIGTNDAALGKTGVSLQDYRANLEHILGYLTTNWSFDKDKIIIVSPPKVNDQRWSEEEAKLNNKSDLFDEVVTKYAHECVEFARQHNLTCLDLNRKMCDLGPDYMEFLSDGLHLSRRGGHLLYEEMKILLESHLMQQGIKENYPSWESLWQEIFFFMFIFLLYLHNLNEDDLFLTTNKLNPNILKNNSLN